MTLEPSALILGAAVIILPVAQALREADPEE
jgi:hypothetical protein